MKKKLSQKCVAVVLILSFFLAFSPFSNRAEAAKVNFSQGILPVKFVYLDKHGKIQKIWSNVEPKDDMYVVKFFDAKSQQELPAEKKNIEAFVKNLDKKNKEEDNSKRVVKIIYEQQRLEEIVTHI